MRCVPARRGTDTIPVLPAQHFVEAKIARFRDAAEVVRLYRPVSSREPVRIETDADRSQIRPYKLIQPTAGHKEMRTMAWSTLRDATFEHPKLLAITAERASHRYPKLMTGSPESPDAARGALDRTSSAGGRLELGAEELAYAARARSANTVKGYRSDWAEWTSWCTAHGIDPMPADPVAVAKYLTGLARYGAKIGTMSRRLSSIRFAEKAAGVSSQLRRRHRADGVGRDPTHTWRPARTVAADHAAIAVGNARSHPHRSRRRHPITERST